MSTLILIALLSTLSARADNCAPFYNLKEVKAEDEKAHTALKKTMTGLTAIRSYRATCAAQVKDNTESNKESTIAADTSGQSAAVKGSSEAYDAVMDAIKATQKAEEAIRAQQAKGRKGMDACLRDIKADRKSLLALKEKLDDEATAMGKCTPPPPPKNPDPKDDDRGCRTSLFGCMRDENGYLVPKKVQSNSPPPAPRSAPLNPDGTVNLHPNCPAGKICR